jgi:hypothetical protein
MVLVKGASSESQGWLMLVALGGSAVPVTGQGKHKAVCGRVGTVHSTVVALPAHWW